MRLFQTVGNRYASMSRRMVFSPIVIVSLTKSKLASCWNFYLKGGIQTFWRVANLNITLILSYRYRYCKQKQRKSPPFKMFVYQISGKNCNRKGTFYLIFYRYYSLPWACEAVQLRKFNRQFHENCFTDFDEIFTAVLSYWYLLKVYHKWENWEILRPWVKNFKKIGELKWNDPNACIGTPLKYVMIMIIIILESMINLH